MELIDAAAAARRAVARFRTTYAKYPADHRFYDGRTVGGILAAFDSLGADASPADVANAAGWGEFTQTCNECGREVAVVAQLGETPDYESRTAEVCRDCLVKALALLDATPEARP